MLSVHSSYLNMYQKFLKCPDADVTENLVWVIQNILSFQESSNRIESSSYISSYIFPDQSSNLIVTAALKTLVALALFLGLKSFLKEGSVLRLLVDLLRHTIDFFKQPGPSLKTLLRCCIGLFLRVEVIFERGFRIEIACCSVVSYPRFFKLPGPSLKTLVALLHRPIFEG